MMAIVNETERFMCNFYGVWELDNNMWRAVIYTESSHRITISRQFRSDVEAAFAVDIASAMLGMSRRNLRPEVVRQIDSHWLEVIAGFTKRRLLQEKKYLSSTEFRCVNKNVPLLWLL